MRCVHVDAVRVTMLNNVKNDELSWSAARKSLHSSSWVSAVVVQLIDGGGVVDRLVRASERSAGAGTRI